MDHFDDHMPMPVEITNPHGNTSASRRKQDREYASPNALNPSPSAFVSNEANAAEPPFVSNEANATEISFATNEANSAELPFAPNETNAAELSFVPNEANDYSSKNRVLFELK